MYDSSLRIQKIDLLSYTLEKTREISGVPEGAIRKTGKTLCRSK